MSSVVCSLCFRVNNKKPLHGYFLNGFGQTENYLSNIKIGKKKQIDFFVYNPNNSATAPC